MGYEYVEVAEVAEVTERRGGGASGARGAPGASGPAGAFLTSKRELGAAELWAPLAHMSLGMPVQFGVSPCSEAVVDFLPERREQLQLALR